MRVRLVYLVGTVLASLTAAEELVANVIFELPETGR
jgi:hypothetical protein